jgi:hypothetical protein
MTTGKTVKFSVSSSKFSVSEKAQNLENLESVQVKIRAVRLWRTADNSLGWQLQVRPAVEHTVNHKACL